MKLLIVTQVVDKTHPVLGFFHRWIEEFSKHCEQLTVICLEEGEHDLPDNVEVLSLGKEANVPKHEQLLRFYKYIWSYRNSYDAVFVHMNQIYVILGAPFWRLCRKKIGLWYAHGSVSVSLKTAVVFAGTIFTSTEEGLDVNTRKKEIVGQGIDVQIFNSKSRESKKNDVLRLITVGRISQSKNIETLLRACVRLKEKNIKFLFKIIGTPITEEEKTYFNTMKNLVKDLEIGTYLEWVGAVQNDELPIYLQESDVFIHDGSTNSLDKVLVESSLCGCVVISSNPAYKSVTNRFAPDYLFDQGDHKRLSEIIQTAAKDKQVVAVRNHFLSSYTIQNLISSIISKY